MIEAKKLPYESTALAPHVSKDTLDTHHGKHYNGYVNNLNKLIKGTVFENSSLEDIVLQSSGPIFNNAAQAWNHEFYFDGLTPKDTTESDGLAKAIGDKWGSVEKLQQDFNDVAKKLFGSGWTWLVWDTFDKTLDILNLENAGNPMCESENRPSEQYVPLLVCDVWEHAYYLDNKNDRGSYLSSFWNTVNWDFVNANFEKVK